MTTLVWVSDRKTSMFGHSSRSRGIERLGVAVSPGLTRWDVCQSDTLTGPVPHRGAGQLSWRGRPTRRTRSCRLVRSFDITYAKAQDATRAELNNAAESGRLQGFVHTYLAMQDHHLPVPLSDLVPRSAVIRYHTNFNAMSAADLDLLATRGEQLTRVLLTYYCPQLTCAGG